MATGEAVRLVEVGPRDGLQNLPLFVRTDRKIGLIRRLAACGLPEIQIGGFVHPRAIAQFRDIREVAAGVADLKGVTLTALVPNLRGARDAVACGIKKLNFFFSVSRSHNLNNVRQTPEESLAALKAIRAELLPGVTGIRVDLATAFGCPFEGPVPLGDLLGAVEAAVSLGIGEITLCDTVGFGNPRLVEEVTRACRERFPEATFGMHFHNTRGLGIANTLAAYQQGIRIFDAALGGLGGCPFAPGASGNTATEETLFLFHEMGVETGVAIAPLLETAHYLQGILPDVALPSALLRAGLPRRAGPPASPAGDGCL